MNPQRKRVSIFPANLDQDHAPPAKRKAGLFSSARFSEPVFATAPPQVIKGVDRDIAALVKTRESKREATKWVKVPAPETTARTRQRAQYSPEVNLLDGDGDVEEGRQQVSARRFERGPAVNEDRRNPKRRLMGAGPIPSTSLIEPGRFRSRHSLSTPSFGVPPMVPRRKEWDGQGAEPQRNEEDPSPRMPMREIVDRMMLSFPRITLRDDEPLTYAQAVSAMAARAIKIGLRMNDSSNEASWRRKRLNVSVSRLLPQGVNFSQRRARQMMEDGELQESDDEDEDPTRYVFEDLGLDGSTIVESDAAREKCPSPPRCASPVSVEESRMMVATDAPGQDSGILDSLFAQCVFPEAEFTFGAANGFNDSNSNSDFNASNDFDAINDFNMPGWMMDGVGPSGEDGTNDNSLFDLDLNLSGSGGGSSGGVEDAKPTK